MLAPPRDAGGGAVTAAPLTAVAPLTVGVVGRYEGRDVYGRWWPLTLLSQHADGTYRAHVHDNVDRGGKDGKVWDGVHIANIRPAEYDEFLARHEKGLRNRVGEQNCFLNVVVQALLHVPEFRDALLAAHGAPHHCTGSGCVLCATCVLFTQHQFSDADHLKPTVLRAAVASAFSGSDEFRLNEQADPAELLPALLTRLHEAVVRGADPDATAEAQSPRGAAAPARRASTEDDTAPSFARTALGLCVGKQLRCGRCGMRSEVELLWEWVHYIPAAVLFRPGWRTCIACSAPVAPPAAPAAGAAAARGSGGTPLACRQCGASQRRGAGLMMALARRAELERRSCGNEEYCGVAGQAVRQFVIELPKVVTFGIKWRSEQAAPDEISHLLEHVDGTARLGDLVDHVEKGAEWASLLGMVCYALGHYVAYCWSDGLREWVFCDDERVARVGGALNNAKDHAARGRWQPCLLFYRTRADPPQPGEHVAPLPNADSGGPACSPPLQPAAAPAPGGGGAAAAAASTAPPVSGRVRAAGARDGGGAAAGDASEQPRSGFADDGAVGYAHRSARGSEGSRRPAHLSAPPQPSAVQREPQPYVQSAVGTGDVVRHSAPPQQRHHNGWVVDGERPTTDSDPARAAPLPRRGYSSTARGDC